MRILHETFVYLEGITKWETPQNKVDEEDVEDYD
jgi:hypothetical protein